MSIFSRLYVASAIAALSFACAAANAPTAPAPRISGFGDIHRAINTRVPAAQTWFDQGVEQAYAFDAAEAVRAFKAALEADPACAICAWGVAWQLGPNYNSVRSGDYPEARRYALQAQQLLGTSDTPLTRDLVRAMITRYGAASGSAAVDVLNAQALCGSSGTTKTDPLDLAYAQQVRAIADAYPGDPEVQALYAEAALIATPGPGFDTATLETLPRTRALIERIEAALQQNPRHTGLIHYLTHVADTPRDAQHAALTGDALLTVAPNAPHLLHMPSHLYLRAGRYADVLRVNRMALDAQERLSAAVEQQGFTILTNWHGHNRTYSWIAAQLQGDRKTAMQHARDLAGFAAKREDDWGPFLRSYPLLTMLQFERWQDILAATRRASDTARLAPNVVAHARAIALLRTGQKADAELADLTRQSEQANARGPEGIEGAALATLLLAHAKAEQALARGDRKGARIEFLRSLAAEPTFGNLELPRFAMSAQRNLGRALLTMRDFKGAEAAYRSDLSHYPNNVWALRGLRLALAGQRETG